MAISGGRFTHVAYRTSDLERSIRWYEEAFGARKVFHAQQQGERPELLFLEFAKGQFIELFTNGRPRYSNRLMRSVISTSVWWWMIWNKRYST